MSSASSNREQITVQVVYALPHAQHVSTIQVDRDSTALEAVIRSTLLERFPELTSTTLNIGSFGKIMAHNGKLEEGMRIEIYRPLILDPKESRRKRAQLAKK